VARRHVGNHHIIRMILIGIYSDTGPGAMLKLRWVPSISGGWVDVDNGILHRRGSQETRSRKRQPPVRIHHRLLRHLRKWRRDDLAKGTTNVIHFEGRPIKTVRRSWETVRQAAGAQRKDTPHVLRHSAATWFMSWGLHVALIAGYLGMSIDVLMTVYAHFHPQFQEVAAQSTPGKPANRKGPG
jgi:integrase